jgi:AcrR family transcriptional regulator
LKVNPQTGSGRDGGTIPRTSRGEHRRAALLDAGCELFLELGYEGVSVEEIVRRVGGSKASVYSYFGSKEGLFWAVLDRLSEEFIIELGVPAEADADVEGTLIAVGQRFLRVFLDPSLCGLFRTMIAESSRFPELARAFYESGRERSLQTLGHYLQLQHRAGRIDCPDHENMATQFLELMKGTPHFRMLLSLPPFANGFDPDAHIVEAVKLFLYGCARTGKT